MKRLFDRPLEADHPWKAALLELWDHGDTAERLLACNLALDHRVSKEREKRMLREIPSPIDGQDLYDELKSFYKTKINAPFDPDYIDEKINDQNFVSGWRSRPSELSESIQLAQVLDLSGLRLVFQAASGRKDAPPSIQRLKGKADEKEFESWLDMQLKPTGGPERFVPQALEVLANEVKKSPFQPSWVTFWSHLENHLDQGPARWLDALGVWKPIGRPRWLIVLRYPARRCRLLRPTVLDTDYTPFHFPSPPWAQLSAGGHPVDLGNTVDSSHAPLLSELIHSQIPPRVGYWRNAGSRCEQVTPATSSDPSGARSRHLARLAFGKPRKVVQEWCTDREAIGR